MTAYLLTWKPAKWPWEDIQDTISKLDELGFWDGRWSCGITKKINIGDRVFLMRQGQDKPGIIGSGWATSTYYEDDHWDENANSDFALYVNIRLDILLDAENEDIFPRSKLRKGILADGPWDTQNSGVTIPDKIASKLESEWAKFLASKRITQHSFKAEGVPGEIADEDENEYYEGSVQQVRVNRYERNTKARKACINHYGLNCSVCSFNFEKSYGEIGVGYIHVHHLTSLSEVGKEYKLDPIKDLRPVCPNCHAMIHSRKPAYTIEEMKLLAGIVE